MAKLNIALFVLACFTSAIVCSTVPVDDGSDALLLEPAVTHGPEFEKSEQQDNYPEPTQQDNYPEMTPNFAVVEQTMGAELERDGDAVGDQDNIPSRISGLELRQFRNQELLKERLEKLEKSNDDLRMKLKVQEIETEAKIMNIGRFVSERDELVNQTLQNLQTEQSGCPGRVEKVAFSAYLSQNMNYIGRKQTIKFDKTTLNYGRSYCACRGIFTAPRNGIYVFSFFVGQRGHNQIFVELVVNGQDKSDAAAETTTFWQDSQGGNVVVLQLIKGDRVYIRKNIWGSHIESSSSIRLATFSGFLLYPL